MQTFESEIRGVLIHLEHSHRKAAGLPADPQLLDSETLETWESYVARFARVTDIFLSKYLRTYALRLDPAFRAELRDFVDKAEKLGLISDAEHWMVVRELRDKAKHEYSRSDLMATIAAVRSETNFVFVEFRRIFP